MKSTLKPHGEHIHGTPEVVGFRMVGPYTVEIRFNDEVTRKVDFTDVLHGQLYGPLKDPTLFLKVRLEEGNLIWPNGADFDPEVLHDWPERKSAMVAAAAHWRYSTITNWLADISLWLLIGFAAGIATKFILHAQQATWVVVLLGISGAILGGLLARVVSPRVPVINHHERITMAYATVIGAILIPVVAILLS